MSILSISRGLLIPVFVRFGGVFFPLLELKFHQILKKDFFKTWLLFHFFSLKGKTTRQNICVAGKLPAF